LLLIVAVHHEGGAEHHHAEAAGVGEAVLRQLLVEDELLLGREAGSAVLLRPGRCDPSALPEGVPPALRALTVVRGPAALGVLTASAAVAARACLAAVLLDERADLGAECRLLRCIDQFHRGPSSFDPVLATGKHTT